MVNLPSISDIKCHEPSRSIIVTSSGPAWGDVSIQMFSPPLSDPGDEERPYWLLGEGTEPLPLHPPKKKKQPSPNFGICLY